MTMSASHVNIMMSLYMTIWIVSWNTSSAAYNTLNDSNLLIMPAVKMQQA